MAGIVDYLKDVKEGFVSGMRKLERKGRGVIFGPQGASDKMKMRARRLQQAAGGAVVGGAKVTAATTRPWKPKTSINERAVI